jgi:hypothetical protein
MKNFQKILLLHAFALSNVIKSFLCLLKEKNIFLRQCKLLIDSVSPPPPHAISAGIYRKIANKNHFTNNYIHVIRENAYVWEVLNYIAG